MSNSQQSSYLSKQEKSEGASKGGWGLLSGGHKGALISGGHKKGAMSGGLISGRHKRGVHKGGV